MDIYGADGPLSGPALQAGLREAEADHPRGRGWQNGGSCESPLLSLVSW